MGAAHLGVASVQDQIPGTIACPSGPLVSPNVQFLTSGYAEHQPFFITAPSGQCAHGPPTPLCAVVGGVVGIPAGISCLAAGMHKDDFLRPFYSQAYNAAVTDTIQFVNDVLINAPSNIPDNVCMVMTDSPCPGSSNGGGGNGGSCTVFDTGVDDAGMLLPTPTTDPHYTLAGGAAFVVQNGTFPLDGNWMPENSGSQSQRIGPSPVGASGATFAQFVYRTTVNVTRSSTFTLSGQWATDNEGVDILINGISAGNTIPAPNGIGYKTFTVFSISSGFQDGPNTLDFVVHNDDGPSGVRIEFFGACP